MSAPVKVPSEIERPDPLIGPLTARQLLILTATALALYATWWATHTTLSLPAFAALALPIAGGASALALGRRDGVSLDAFAWAIACHYATTRPSLTRLRNTGTGAGRVPDWITAPAFTRRHTTRTTSAGLPIGQVTPVRPGVGVIDLHRDGQALVAVATTVNLALCTPGEQEALIAIFARYLHSLAAPVQILIRTLPIDLSAGIRHLRHSAALLTHPALSAAAIDHADFLAGLADTQHLLGRQVLLVLRDPTPTTRAAHPGTPRGQPQLTHRLAEATTLLAPAGITLTPLDATQAAAVLAAATHPARLTPAHTRAGADTTITATPKTPTPMTPTTTSVPRVDHHRGPVAHPRGFSPREAIHPSSRDDELAPTGSRRREQRDCDLESPLTDPAPAWEDNPAWDDNTDWDDDPAWHGDAADSADDESIAPDPALGSDTWADELPDYPDLGEADTEYEPALTAQRQRRPSRHRVDPNGGWPR